MAKYLFTITGPSGAGKTTLVRRITQIHCDTVEIVSDTTRKQRDNEIDGVDYNFISKSLMKKRKYIELASYNGYDYGIAQEEIESKLKYNIVFAVVSVEGMICLKHYIKHNHPEIKCISIFIDTPAKYLVNRLVDRGDSKDNIIQRIENIKKTNEYENKEFCDFIFKPTNKESIEKSAMTCSFLSFLQKQMLDYPLSTYEKF